MGRRKRTLVALCRVRMVPVLRRQTEVIQSEVKQTETRVERFCTCGGFEICR
jgi:hypothetical protein